MSKDVAITGRAKDKAQREAFAALIEAQPAEQAALAQAVRKAVLEIMPGVIEIVWPHQNIVSWGTGPKKMSQHFTYVSFAKDHVNVGFYYGAELDDSEVRLEGSGKKMRHVKVRSKKEVAALRGLIERASTHRVPPLA